MSVVSAITLIITVIIIYYFLYKFYTVMFRITGVTQDKSRFQAVSLLTNAGYTTGESEIIAGDKTRRAIAKAAMLTGYFFSVIIVSLVINLFLSIDFTNFNTELVVLLIGFGSLLAFFIIMQLPMVQRNLDKAIDNLTARLFKSAAKENYISVIDNYGDDAICKIYLYRVPDFLQGKMIAESDIKKKYNVNLLMYERKSKTRYVNKDTILSDKDSLLAFGRLDSIKDAFLLKEESRAKLETDKDTEKLANINEISVIDNYSYQILAEINIHKVPMILDGKTLIESHLKDYFSINVMMVSRAGSPIRLTKDTIIEEGDKVIAFGPYQTIETVFGEKRRQERL